MNPKGPAVPSTPQAPYPAFPPFPAYPAYPPYVVYPPQCCCEATWFGEQGGPVGTQLGRPPAGPETRMPAETRPLSPERLLTTAEPPPTAWPSGPLAAYVQAWLSLLPPRSLQKKGLIGDVLRALDEISSL